MLLRADITPLRVRICHARYAGPSRFVDELDGLEPLAVDWQSIKRPNRVLHVARAEHPQVCETMRVPVVLPDCQKDVRNLDASSLDLLLKKAFAASDRHTAHKQPVRGKVAEAVTRTLEVG